MYKYPIIPSKFLWTEGRSRFLVICSHSATGLLSYLETCFPAAFRDKRFSKASKYHARSAVSDISGGIENIINVTGHSHIKPDINRLFSRVRPWFESQVVDYRVVLEVCHRCLVMIKFWSNDLIGRLYIK